MDWWGTGTVTSPASYDHLRAADADHPEGVYRVVGTGGDRVTLLRVGDADGRRIHTGETVTVERAAFDGFEPAPNPDGNRPLGRALVSGLETAYWSVRAFGQQLRAHPVAAAVAGLLVVAGGLGESYLPLPEVAFGALLLAGGLLLAYVGGGRL